PFERRSRFSLRREQLQGIPRRLALRARFLHNGITGVFHDSEAAEDDGAFGGLGTCHARIVTCTDLSDAQKTAPKTIAACAPRFGAKPQRVRVFWRRFLRVL